jgi:dihydroorotase
MILFSKKLWNEKKGSFEPGCLELNGNKIKSIKFGKPEGVQSKRKIKDLGSLFIGPSAIDLHVHSRGFDESHKEVFETLEVAAFKGGVSVGACLANTRPRLDSVQMIDRFIKEAKKSQVEFIPYAAVSKNLEGKHATNWAALLKRPIAGLSDDGRPIYDGKMMEAVLKATKKSKKILLLHEEDLEISNASIIHRSETSMRLGIEGSPAASEDSMVERDLALSKKLKAPIHFGHISSARAVSLIRKAKRQGVNCSAELTPHHGLLSVDHAEEIPLAELSRFKVCPVIRTKDDRTALWKALHDGTLDCFASDHAPHSGFEKRRPITQAAHGMIAFEYYFPLYNEVRLKSKLPWKRFFTAFSSRPAELLGLGKSHGRLAPGYFANFMVFDPNAKQKLHWSLSRSKNSPFEGAEIRGKVVQHWLKGKKVYD